MGFLRNLMRTFTGKKKQASDNLAKTKAYWDGMAEEASKKEKLAYDKWKEAKSTLNNAKEKRETLVKLVDEMRATAEECRERYKETKNQIDMTSARNAFDKMNEHKEKLRELDEQISLLEQAEEKFRILKESAGEQIKKQKMEISKKKQRLEFAKTMDELMDGIEDIENMELVGGEEVDIDYHKSMIDLDNMTSKVIRKSTDSDFDKFFNEGTTA